MPDVIIACAILHNILRKEANEDLEALGSMADIGGPEDDDEDAYSDTEGWDIGDDGIPQSRSRNNGEGLRRSLASYLGSQRGVTS